VRRVSVNHGGSKDIEAIEVADLGARSLDLKTANETIGTSTIKIECLGGAVGNTDLQVALGEIYVSTR
jgi:hypothetical protein